MGHSAEYTASAGAGKTCVVTVTAAIPTGSLCFLAIAIPRNTLPANSYTIADTAGNTWTQIQAGVGAGAPLNVYISLYKTRLKTALSSGDTVTITAPVGQTEWAAVLEVFDDTTYTLERGAFTSDGSGTNVNIGGSVTLVRSSTLMVAVAAWFTGSASLSAGSGWSIGAKQMTSGVNHCAMAMMWQYGSAAGQYTVSATLDTGSAWSLAMVGYGPEAVSYTVWNGTQEVAVSSATIWDGTQEIAVFEASVNG